MFPAFESLLPAIEPARQLLQLGSAIRDRSRQLGVGIDGGSATTSELARWLDDVAKLAAPVGDILQGADMQATLRMLTGDGKLSITDERNALAAALDAARTAAKDLVPYLAPVFDDKAGRLRSDVPLASAAPKEPLGAFRTALDALVATIAPGAA